MYIFFTFKKIVKIIKHLCALMLSHHWGPADLMLARFILPGLSIHMLPFHTPQEMIPSHQFYGISRRYSISFPIWWGPEQHFHWFIFVSSWFSWAYFDVRLDLSTFELLFTKVTLLYLMQHKMFILLPLIKNLHTIIASSSVLPGNFIPLTFFHLHT